MGIVYGYGRENAFYAGRDIELAFYLKKYPAVCFFPFEPIPDPCLIIRPITRFCIPRVWSRPEPKVDPRFDSLEAEWQWLQGQFITIPQFDVPYLFLLPCFSAVKGEQTQKLLKKYSKARNVLAKLYCEKTFTKGVVAWVKDHRLSKRSFDTHGNKQRIVSGAFSKTLQEEGESRRTLHSSRMPKAFGR